MERDNEEQQRFKEMDKDEDRQRGTGNWNGSKRWTVTANGKRERGIELIPGDWEW
jgi:hypothetical protein